MYDWNTATVPSWRGGRPVAVVDETLRDGLQNATAVDPSLEDKLDLVRWMERIGVDVVSVGLPAASQRAVDEAAAVAQVIREEKLKLRPTAAARTVARDVTAVADCQQRAGIEIEVYAFIGSSPIRHYTENWDRDFLTRHIREAAEVARKHEVPFCLVTEDTTRARPEVLEEMFKCALDGGASRLCLCDTVGHATPDGVARLVKFTRDLLVATGHQGVGLDWHAHNDRGLALQTALWASELGVDRVHGTAMGIGERVGNVPIEVLLLNLGLLGAKREATLADLRGYCERAVASLAIDHIPDTHPLFGKAMTERARAEAQAVEAPPEESSTHEAPSRLPVLVPMQMRVNGDRRNLAVDPSRTLLEVLRYDLDLFGTKQGCDKGDCGACTVHVDGRPILSCLSLALTANGRDVRTVEALPGAGDLHPLLDAFDRTGAAQCGFCTPGFLMTAWALLEENPAPSRDEIKQALSGNLCRCTGYKAIIDAVELAGAMLRGDEDRMLGLPGREHLPGPIDDPKLGRPPKKPAKEAPKTP